MDDNSMQVSLHKYLKRTDDTPERAEKYVHFYQLAKEKGVVPFRYERIAEEYTDDYFAETGIDKAEKEWFYERGFTSYKAGWYGLTKENYNDYISDFDFYSPKNYSKNRLLIKWFDYKLTTYYVLSSFKQFMPRHFFYVAGGELAPMDAGLARYGTADDVYENVDTTFRVFDQCDKTVVLDRSLYLYRKRLGAITEDPSKRNIDDWLLARSHFEAYIRDNIPEIFKEEDLKRFYRSRINQMIRFYCELSRSKEAGETEWINNFREHIIKTASMADIEKCGLFTRAGIQIMIFCPSLLKTVYPVFSRLYRSR